MILTSSSGISWNNRLFHKITLLASCLPILLTACANPNSMPAPLAAPRGEIRTDVSEIDDAMALRMAKRFEDAGDFGSALNMYRRAVLISPNNTTALNGMARIYAQAGAQEEAARYYSRILQLEPKNSKAAARVAENHIFKGEAREAISFINQFLLSAPGTVDLYNALGIAHDLDGSHGDAQQAYSRGLGLAPNDSAITSNLALSFAVREEYQTALALLERVLGDSAGNDQEGRSIARQNLALVYALSGQLDTAVEIASAVLSEEEVAINRIFYARLPALSSKDKARAVFLGSLPSPPEPGNEAVADADSPMDQRGTGPLTLSAPPLTEEERDAAASRIVRSQGVVEVPPPPPAATSNDPAIEEDLAATVAALDGYPPYWVQLSSYRSPKNAKNGWNTLSAQFPDLLAGYIGYLQTYQSADRGQFFRLMVQASETRSAANLVCGTFKIEGMECLVIKTSRNIERLQDTVD